MHDEANEAAHIDQGGSPSIAFEIVSSTYLHTFATRGSRCADCNISMAYSEASRLKVDGLQIPVSVRAAVAKVAKEDQSCER